MKKLVKPVIAFLGIAAFGICGCAAMLGEPAVQKDLSNTR